MILTFVRPRFANGHFATYKFLGNCSLFTAEIVEYTSPEEVSVCTLASIRLSSFVRSDKTFDYEDLLKTARVATRNLDNVINVNNTPVSEAKTSNERHRPVALGVQGLADVFFKMGLPFDSDEARKINKRIFEVIYYGALLESSTLAVYHGSYPSYTENGGCPASKNLLQRDLWGSVEDPHDPLLDWSALRDTIRKHGLRNSLLTGNMPTASTALLLGSSESFEPLTSNIYTRRTNTGEFVVINKFLVDDLIELGLWDEEMRQEIIRNKGSVQGIERIPENMRKVYKTVWEYSQKNLIEMCADRGPFISQSQSFNLYFSQPSFQKVYSAIMYGWKKGLKTICYYLRSQPATDAIQFTVKKESLVCSKENQNCESCSG